MNLELVSSDFIEKYDELVKFKIWIEDGDTLIVKKDGNAWCFILPNFKDLQNSRSVWTGDPNAPTECEIGMVYANLLGED